MVGTLWEAHGSLHVIGMVLGNTPYFRRSICTIPEINPDATVLWIVFPIEIETWYCLLPCVSKVFDILLEGVMLMWMEESDRDFDSAV